MSSPTVCHCHSYSSPFVNHLPQVSLSRNHQMIYFVINSWETINNIDYIIFYICMKYAVQWCFHHSKLPLLSKICLLGLVGNIQQSGLFSDTRLQGANMQLSISCYHFQLPLPSHLLSFSGAFYFPIFPMVLLDLLRTEFMDSILFSWPM